LANENLSSARKAKNDEFYTQYRDIEREMNAYLEFNSDVFRGKTVLLPCDDPEWSNFTKYFAQNFQAIGLKKLISTSYAPNSKPKDVPYQPTLFEMESEVFSEEKTQTNGKIFVLTRDKNGDDVIDVEDLEWDYLEGDGDFRSDEIEALRDESDIVITNPPFSLFRQFLAWLVESKKDFVIIGNLNAITYREVFPLIKDNQIWLGSTISSGDREFRVPDNYPLESAGWRIDDLGQKYIRVKGVRWYSTIEHGRRHQPLNLMSEAENIKFSKDKKVKGVGYQKYDNYDAIEVPSTLSIPSDYEGVMGVPITFLDKYNPEQFEIIGNGQTMANELGIKPVGQQFVDDYYSQGNKGQINAKWNNLVFHLGDKVVVPYQRILIRQRSQKIEY
jgi:hypothetical protein